MLGDSASLPPTDLGSDTVHLKPLDGIGVESQDPPDELRRRPPGPPVDLEVVLMVVKVGEDDSQAATSNRCASR